MPLPVPDPGIAALAAELPCFVRRMIILPNDPTKTADYGMFPNDGQNIDTPPNHVTKWTTDDRTHP